MRRLIFLFLCLAALASASRSNRSRRYVTPTVADVGAKNGEEHEHVGVHVVSWRWDEVGVLITITLFIVLSGLAKVAFHHVHWLSSRIPESCLLVIVGVVMGAIIKALEIENGEDGTDDEEKFTFPKFTPDLFFFFLLPPIILEAAYSLYDKAFFDNLITILVMAVVGTAFNFILIGLLLYLVYLIGAMGKIYGPFNPSEEGGGSLFQGEYDLGLIEVMTFASLISAVDPVAVLAIFQEVGVNPDLYFLLFGESLLNDGVAVVFYNMMNTFAEMVAADEPLTSTQILLGLASFFTVALGGLSIGIIMGGLTALITRTTSEVRVVEPLALFGMGYLAYITAELFHWSGIISLIGCGIVQAHYAFRNISKKSYTTVKYFIKMLSSLSDCIIFLFLGIALVDGPHYWHTGFVVWTISFTLICRFLGVYGLTFLANRRRLKKVNLQEQFIMAYGGLRGAVGFSLVSMVDSKVVPPAQMFVTTTLAVVMFTVFFQGGTIKFLVNLLDIDKAEEKQRMISEEVNETVMEHVMAGIEIISGKRGSQYFGQLMERIDQKYFTRWLCKTSRDNDLMKMYEELAISDHLCNLYGPSVLIENMEKVEENLEAEDFIEHDLESTTGSEMGPLSKRSREGSFRRPLLGSTHHRYSTAGILSPDNSVGPGFFPLPSTSSTVTSSGVPSSAGLHRTRTISGQFLRTDSRRFSGRSMRSNRSNRPSIDESRKGSREERDVLVNALRRNSFSRLHQKYNRNLINDDDQEMESHLRRRHDAARRMSQMITDTDNLTLAVPGGNPTIPGTPRKTRNASIAGMLHPSATMEGPMLRIPDRGLETIMQRQKERIRSISISSDRSMASSFDQDSSQGQNEGQMRFNQARRPLDRSASAKGYLASGNLSRNRKLSSDSTVSNISAKSANLPPALPPRGGNAVGRTASNPVRFDSVQDPSLGIPFPAPGDLGRPSIIPQELSAVTEENEESRSIEGAASSHSLSSNLNHGGNAEKGAKKATKVMAPKSELDGDRSMDEDQV